MENDDDDEREENSEAVNISERMSEAQTIDYNDSFDTLDNKLTSLKVN